MKKKRKEKEIMSHCETQHLRNFYFLERIMSYLHGNTNSSHNSETIMSPQVNDRFKLKKSKERHQTKRENGCRLKK